MVPFSLQLLTSDKLKGWLQKGMLGKHSYKSATLR